MFNITHHKLISTVFEMEYITQNAGKLVSVHNMKHTTYDLNKLPEQSHQQLNTYDLYKLRTIEKHRKMAEETRKKCQLQTKKTIYGLPDVSRFDVEIQRWNEQNPNYFKQLHEKENEIRKCTVYITRNDKYVVHPEHIKHITDEEYANLETDPIIIDSYGV